MKYLACGADGRSYVFQFSGHFDVQVVAPSRAIDSPYSVCVGTECHPVEDARWKLEVRAGDTITVRSSTSGPLLDARLCPTGSRSPFAEWSTDDEAIDSSARRPLPELGVVVQEIGQEATSPAPASAMVLWIDSQIERATTDAAPDERRAMRFLACAADGHGYTFTMPGRFDLLAIGSASRLDSPYSVCVGAAGLAPACHAVAAGTRWQVDVGDGDEVTVQSSQPEARLDARLCPSDDRSPFAEWSQAAEAVRTTDKRPPPYLGIVVQSLHP